MEAKIFLLHIFTACSELCNSTCRCSLGGLSACVGVNLCIEYHDVDVFAGSKNVVNTAESDIVCPSVTAEDPLGFLSKEVFVLNDVLAYWAVNSLQCGNQLVCSSAV